MYERTIASDHRLYQITLPGTATKLKDLLSVDDLQDYNSFINTEKSSEVVHATLQSKGYKRIVVDGYVVCYTSTIYVSTSDGGAEEPISAGIPFTCPVAFWLDKTYIRGSGTAFIRVFFS